MFSVNVIEFVCCKKLMMTGKTFKTLFMLFYILVRRLKGRVGWARTTEIARRGWIPALAILKTWNAVLATCPNSCSALVGGWSKKVHTDAVTDLPHMHHSHLLRQEPWWSKGVLGRNGHRWPLVAHQREYKPSKVQLKKKMFSTWFMPVLARWNVACRVVYVKIRTHFYNHMFK